MCWLGLARLPQDLLELQIFLIPVLVSILGVTLLAVAIFVQELPDGVKITFYIFGGIALALGSLALCAALCVFCSIRATTNRIFDGLQHLLLGELLGDAAV